LTRSYAEVDKALANPKSFKNKFLGMSNNSMKDDTFSFLRTLTIVNFSGLFLTRYGAVLPRVQDRFTSKAEVTAVATFLVQTGAVTKGYKEFDLQVKVFCDHFKSHVFAKALIASKTTGEIQVSKITPSKELAELRQNVLGLQALVREHTMRIDQLESRLNETTPDTGNGAANTPKDAPIRNYLITTKNPDDAREGNAMSPSPGSFPKTANETSVQPITESANGATIAASTTAAVVYDAIVDASTTRPPPEPAASAASNANKKRPAPESTEVSTGEDITRAKKARTSNDNLTDSATATPIAKPKRDAQLDKNSEADNDTATAKPKTDAQQEENSDDDMKPAAQSDKDSSSSGFASSSISSSDDDSNADL
jgi:hypothetical protein